MRTFITAVVIAVVVALGAAIALERIQLPASVAYSTSAVRI